MVHGCAYDSFSLPHDLPSSLLRRQLGLLEDEDLFKRRVEEIEPMMRYCRYKLDPSEGPPGEGREESGAGATAVASKLESVAAESQMTRGGSPESIEWRGKAVSVRSEALGSTVLKADALAKRLFTSAKTSKRAARRGKKAAVDHPEDSKVEVEPAPGLYLKVLGAYDDALLKVAQEMSKLQGKGAGVKVEGRRSELEVLRCYATHRKLGLLVRRNERIARELQEKRSSGGGSKKGAGDEGKLDRSTAAADVVQAYDALLQSARAMIVNLGGAEDAAGQSGMSALFVLALCDFVHACAACVICNCAALVICGEARGVFSPTGRRGVRMALSFAYCAMTKVL